MKVSTLMAALVVGLMIVITWYFVSPTFNRGGQVCTAEAKLCPDGSYVGRTGPNCEFAACPQSATSTATTTPAAYETGIRGSLLAGPTCPVETPEEPCPKSPLQTLVAVYKEGDAVHAVSLTRSDPQGKFEVSLPPGRYRVGAGESKYPSCPTTPVTVPKDDYMDITIECDTGIR